MYITQLSGIERMVTYDRHNKNVQEHIKKHQRLKALLRSSPLEWIPIALTGIATFKYRYIYRCVGKNTIVGYRTTIANFSNVRIGDNCLIQDHVYLRAGQAGSIRLADYCAINSFAKLFGHGGIDVGSHTQIGPGVVITTTSHDYRKSLITEFKPVQLGCWAWIGTNAVILPGTRIGKHTVIGAGSVVTRDIPDHAVAVGNPARIIAYVSESRELG